MMYQPRALLIFLAFLSGIFVAFPAEAQNHVITDPGDSGAGTLRDAIVNSAANDTITFSFNGTIQLTSGELLISHNLTITGPGGGLLTVSGAAPNRVFEIGPGAVVTISGITIANGQFLGTPSQGQASAPGGPGLGGGILSAGNLTLFDCCISNNVADGGLSDTGLGAGNGSGGGIYNSGTLSIVGCTLVKNTAAGGNAGASDAGDAFGGAIANIGFSSLSIVNSTISGNVADGGNSQFGGAASGGGIYLPGTNSPCSLVNCTITANTAFGGSTSSSFGTLGEGGGVSADGGGITVRNTLIFGNVCRGGAGGQGSTGSAIGPDLAGNSGSQGRNFVGNADGGNGWLASDLTGSSGAPLDPQAGPLQNNGGPTQTIALRTNSPCIDAGDDAVLTAPFNITTDQRGASRIGGSHVDIGAFEFGENTYLVTTLADSVVGSLRSAIAFAGNGDRITFSPLVTGTITLTGGELFVTNQINIIGPGASLLAISGNSSDRVLEVYFGAGLNLSGVTIRDGLEAPAQSGQRIFGLNSGGGGLLVDGTATLTDCVITNCHVIGGQGGNGTPGIVGAFGGNGFGGGVACLGSISMLRCTVAGNSAAGGKGGTGGGGGLSGGGGAGGLAGNGSGGGFANYGTATMANCTLAGNTATGGNGGKGGAGGPQGMGGNGGTGGESHGAGLSIDSGVLSLVSCTISSNASLDGFGGLGGSSVGGLRGANGTPGFSESGGIFSSNIIPVKNTIIAGNLADSLPDVDATVQSGGFNLVGISDGSSGWLLSEAPLIGDSMFPLDAKLGPLQDNGGATLTMALLNGSPAIDQGSSFGLATDQRGFVRPSDDPSIANASGGDGSDIGAFEINVSPIVLGMANFGGGQFQFLLTGNAGSTYIIQASTDLSNPDWAPIFTNTSPFTYTETNANGFPHRFYRGVPVP